MMMMMMMMNGSGPVLSRISSIIDWLILLCFAGEHFMYYIILTFRDHLQIFVRRSSPSCSCTVSVRYVT